MKKRERFMLLIMGCLLVFISFGVATAAVKVKAAGIMTSIEDDGTVIINTIGIDKRGEKSQSNGYLLSPSVIVQDHRGRSISLKDISLPHHITFEYEYTPKGFMIIFIKQVAG